MHLAGISWDFCFVDVFSQGIITTVCVVSAIGVVIAVAGAIVDGVQFSTLQKFDACVAYYFASNVLCGGSSSLDCSCFNKVSGSYYYYGTYDCYAFTLTGPEYSCSDITGMYKTDMEASTVLLSLIAVFGLVYSILACVLCSRFGETVTYTDATVGFGGPVVVFASPPQGMELSSANPLASGASSNAVPVATSHSAYHSSKAASAPSFLPAEAQPLQHERVEV